MFGLGAKRKRRESAFDLYSRAVDQAREPAFFGALGVPDTVDGRFEMIALHVYLILRRLKAEGQEAADLSQELFDAMFADMDRALRELGVGDLSVGKKVKVMARGFFGRIKAYDEGLAALGSAVLAEAMRRNLYGTGEPDPAHPAAMADYLRREAVALDAVPGDRVIGGEFAFGAPPGQP
jgi:cytochrome b pre-mRNA-processing protein 3